MVIGNEKKKSMILLNESFYFLKWNFFVGKWGKLKGQRVEDRSTQV